MVQERKRENESGIIPHLAVVSKNKKQAENCLQISTEWSHLSIFLSGLASRQENDYLGWGKEMEGL